MRGRNIYIICIGALLLFLLLMELSVPKKFVWKPTFSPNDREPFGCYVFDSVMKRSLPQGYSVTTATLDSIARDSTLRRHNLLIVGNYFNDNREKLLELVDSGLSVCLVEGALGYWLADTLQLYAKTQGNISFRLREKITEQLNLPDSIVWEDSLYGKRIFGVPSSIAGGTIHDPDGKSQIPGWTIHARRTVPDGLGPTVISRKYGRGQIVVSMSPLLFTNYGVLDAGNGDYCMRVLSLMDRNRPVLRLADYQSMVEGTTEQSPLRFFLSSPPLRWAVYLTFATLLLFFIFNAQRRQRAIPVVKEPQNRQLEFARLIGTLYFQRGDHADLLRKKYVYFAENLRRQLFVDIDNEAEDDSSFQRIALQTGLPLNRIRAELRQIRRLVHDDETVLTEDTLQMCIDQMNEICQAM